MNKRLQFSDWTFLVVLCMGLAACSSSKELSNTEYHKSTADISAVISEIPNYQGDLQTLEGKGRAIVSEPGNTERVSIQFSSNRSKSLVKVRNGLGVEGGELLTDGDTLLVYNKVDKFARKIPIRGGNLNHINKLASLNILEMINYPVREAEVTTMRESEELFRLHFATGTEIYVDKKTYLIKEVVHPNNSQLPYSKITYDSYATMKGFTLPRRISIFGAKGESKISLQLTALELNPQLGNLIINLPDDIPIYHQ